MYWNEEEKILILKNKKEKRPEVEWRTYKFIPLSTSLLTFIS
jgi:hypothetical protein